MENLETIVNLDEDYIVNPFAQDYESTFNFIQVYLDKSNFQNVKFDVLKNCAEIVNYLVMLGNVQEKLILDIAQLYVLCKWTGSKPFEFEEDFGKHTINGLKLLLSNSNKFEQNIDNIFNDREYFYVSKILVADLIFEISNRNDKFNDSILKANYIITNYKNRVQKNLINELKNIVG